MTLLLLLLACVSDPVDDPVETTTPDSGTVEVTEEVTVEVESVPGHYEDENGDTVFLGDVIHELALVISDDAMRELQMDPRSYAAAALVVTGGRTWSVGVRLKGNTSFTWFDQKPALIVDFDHVIPDQTWRGIPSIYLHNMIWDPSMVHEHLAYWSFRQAGAPASRTAYTRLTINGEPYGLYLLVEKQNSLYRAQWWEDTSGSVYEAGSFNHPCDLDDGPLDDPCTCYEIDRVGDDAFTDLQALCSAAMTPGTGWVDAVSEHVDWPMFLRSQALEMIVSHYDNYGWNINNYRLYHEPTVDRWYFTPWSTDLAFGWYPWNSDPHCGTYAMTPQEYRGGYLVRRCWADPACSETFLEVIAEQVDALEAMDLGAEYSRVRTMIEPDLLVDPRSQYSSTEAMAELLCLENFIDGRVEMLRAWLGQAR